MQPKTAVAVSIVLGGALAVEGVAGVHEAEGDVVGEGGGDLAEALDDGGRTGGVADGVQGLLSSTSTPLSSI